MIVSAIMLHRRLHIVPVAYIFGLVVAAFRVTHRHVIHAGIGTAVMLGTSRRDGALSIPGDQCRIELVGLVPALRVALERRDHLRKRIAQAVLRLPAEKLACPVDIEDIMVVARLDHRSEEQTSELQSLMLNSY